MVLLWVENKTYFIRFYVWVEGFLRDGWSRLPSGQIGLEAESATRSAKDAVTSFIRKL